MTAVRHVVLVRTGTANLASVRASLDRLGHTAEVTTDPARVRAADRVVLPGVGSFGAAMTELRAHGLDEALRERVAAGRPLLAVCVGLQLLCASSEESPGVAGLGVVAGEVGRFPKTPSLRVPHMGWSAVHPTPGSRLTAGVAYFAHSYRLAAMPEGWSGATAEHGRPFVAALHRDAVFALQFHPELSGPWGEGVLRDWLTEV